MLPAEVQLVQWFLCEADAQGRGSHQHTSTESGGGSGGSGFSGWRVDPNKYLGHSGSVGSDSVAECNVRKWENAGTAPSILLVSLSPTVLRR